jgi:hypothetical protein
LGPALNRQSWPVFVHRPVAGAHIVSR